MGSPINHLCEVDPVQASGDFEGVHKLLDPPIIGISATRDAEALAIPILCQTSHGDAAGRDGSQWCCGAMDACCQRARPAWNVSPCNAASFQRSNTVVITKCVLADGFTCVCFLLYL